MAFKILNHPLNCFAEHSLKDPLFCSLENPLKDLELFSLNKIKKTSSNAPRHSLKVTGRRAMRCF